MSKEWVDEEEYDGPECRNKEHLRYIDDCGSVCCSLLEIKFNLWVTDLCENCQIAEDTAWRDTMYD